MSNSDVIENMYLLETLSPKVLGLYQRNRRHVLSAAGLTDLKTINAALQRLYSELEIADSKRELAEIESRASYLRAHLEWADNRKDEQ